MDSEGIKELFTKNMLAFTSERFAVQAVYSILTRSETGGLRRVLLEIISGRERSEKGLAVRRDVVYDDQAVTLEVSGADWVVWMEPFFYRRWSRTDVLNYVTTLQKHHPTESERVFCIMGHSVQGSDRIDKSADEAYQATVPVIVRHLFWDKILALLAKA